MNRPIEAGALANFLERFTDRSQQCLALAFVVLKGSRVGPEAYLKVHG